jgi:type I restriction enzyme R subunit
VEALAELRSKLAASLLRFNDDRLQKAHEIAYHKAMADIISMVKHAAEAEQELFNAQERVQRAMMRITGSQKFTFEQMVGLERVRVHLIENLSISRDDFDDMPVFSHAGGWGRANREFGGKLEDLVKQFNEAAAV